MCSENTCGTNLFEILIQFSLWVVLVFLLWKIFYDQGWPGWSALVPVFNIIVIGIIGARALWWGIKNMLKEVILIAGLTVACLLFIPEIFGISPTLSAFIKLMPSSVLGGYLVARKLGNDEYNQFIPASVVMFSAVVLMGIVLCLLIVAVKVIGLEEFKNILAEGGGGLSVLDTNMLQTVISMGLFILILMAIFSMPCFFVCGFIGAWFGEKIRFRFSQPGPVEDYAPIDRPVTSKPSIDTISHVNSPLRFRAQGTTEEPQTTEKSPEEMTILEKLKK